MFISQRVLAAMANQLISVPDFSKIGLPLSDHEHGLNLPCVRIWNLNYLSWCCEVWCRGIGHLHIHEPWVVTAVHWAEIH